MKKMLKHLMIYAAMFISFMIFLASIIWNFLNGKDMVVCLIIICYAAVMILLSKSIDKGLS